MEIKNHSKTVYLLNSHFVHDLHDKYKVGLNEKDNKED